MSAATHETNGQIIYSGSSIGNCPLALFYDRVGITGELPPEWLLERYKQGNDNEQLILDLFCRDRIWKMRTKDELVVDDHNFGEYMPDREKDYSDQVQVNLSIPGGVIVRSHLDGIGVLAQRPLNYPYDLGQQRIVEAKAFADSMWKVFKSKGLAGFPKYQWQVSAQMHGAKLPAVFVVGHKDKHGVVFETDFEFVDVAPISLGQIVAKVLGVERAVKTGSFLETGLTCEPMWPCPFYKLHEDDDGKIPVDGLEVDLIDSLAARYEELTVLVKAGADADKKRKELGKEMLMLFEPTGESVVGEQCLMGDLYRVTKTEYWNAGRVDSEKLKADGIDVEKYKTGYTVKYPKIERIGGGDGAGEIAAKLRGM